MGAHGDCLSPCSGANEALVFSIVHQRLIVQVKLYHSNALMRGIRLNN